MKPKPSVLTKVSARRAMFIFQNGSSPLPEPMVDEFIAYLGRVILSDCENGLASRNDLIQTIARAGNHMGLGSKLVSDLVNFAIDEDNLPIIG